MVILRKKIAGASQQSLTRFLRQARRAAGLRGQVNLLVTDSRELRDLNRRFRGANRATDVLSFPPAPAQEEQERCDGDIAVCAEIAAQNARRLGHRVADELKILALHGVLHLAGYDHDTDQGSMARKEARLRRELGLPDSLLARTSTGGGETPRKSNIQSGALRHRTAGSRTRRAR